MGKPVPPFITPVIGPTDRIATDPWQKYFVNLYREDVWTPYLLGSTSAAGQTYNAQWGRLVKIGRFVTLTAVIGLTAVGTVTGAVGIGPLPFPVESQPNSLFRWTGPTSFGGLATPWASLNAQALPGWTMAFLVGLRSGGGTGQQTLAQADLTNTTQFFMTLSYLAQD